MIQLSSDLAKAVEASLGPVELVDPNTNDSYVLIRKQMYDRLLAALDFGEPSEDEEKRLLQDWEKRAGWEDPEASVFDDLKPQ